MRREDNVAEEGGGESRWLGYGFEVPCRPRVRVVWVVVGSCEHICAVASV